MLCLSGFELYSRWVPLKRELKQRRNEYTKLVYRTKKIWKTKRA